MDASELLRQGKLNEALAALQNQIRNDPSNAKLRVFLFQLLCVMGQWDRALTQLNTAAGIDPKTLLMKEVCQQIVQCEALRKDPGDANLIVRQVLDSERRNRAAALGCSRGLPI